MLKKLVKLCAITVGLGAGPLFANDAALVIRNSAYGGLPNLPEPASQQTIHRLLEREGFDTLQVGNATSAEMTRAARRFNALLSEDTDRVVIYLSGHMITSLRNTWFMGAQAGRPDRFSVTRQSISVNALLAVLADHPGRAVLVIAEHESELDLPKGLRPGLDHLSIPQGVTVIRTPPVVGSRVVRMLMSPDYTFAAMRAALPSSVRFSGFAPDEYAFTPDPANPTTGVPIEALQDDTYFAFARDLGTVEALQAYLDRYPAGRNSGTARALIFEIEDSGRRQAENTERALNLSPAERRTIQKDLTLLGYDTRGVDGVFGRGTRAAIADWQRRQSFEETGYLEAQQITRLRRQADRRRAEIAEQEERDRAEHEANERNIWREAKRIDTVAGYRNYLEAYPEGKYRDKAIARLNELGGGWVTEEEIDRDRKHEQRALNNPFVRILAEQRLASLGYRVGNIDGQFDDQTRTAIKAFQKRANLSQTGYVGEETLTALLP